jgi:3-methyladenine DNA glycosylase AlkD
VIDIARTGRTDPGKPAGRSLGLVVVDIEALAHAIDAELQAGSTPERAANERAYLKSKLHHYGTSVPATRAVAKATARRHPELTHDQLDALVNALWAVPVHERRMAAVELLELYCDRLDPEDAALLERLLRESRTWALVDSLAASVVGRLVEQYPELGAVLDRWAADGDFWLRRSAMLALLIPLREGRGDFDRFGRYADAMLCDREFFIRKAIGWVLRDTGRRRPELVYEWLLPRAAQASGVTIHEAVKPLSAVQRAAILAAR